MGTPSYMSPEQASGQHLTAGSDIYSVGAVLYEMLTGQPPFKAATALETLRMVTDQQARRPSTLLHMVDRDLETVCIKCLEKSPEARYDTAEALAADLDRWIRQEPIRARPAGRVERLARWVRRNPLGTGLIASLGIGLSLTMTLLYVVNERRKVEELFVAIHRAKISKDVDELWLDRNANYVSIEAPNLTALAKLPPRDPGELAEVLTFAVRVNRGPVAQADVYAKFLRQIEDRMRKQLHRPIVFNLRLYKLSLGADQPVTRGEADIQRLGFVGYLRAREISPNVHAIVRERSIREAVIYARSGLGITNISAVRGHSAAFAHSNSTISCLAKINLAKAGVYGANLSFYTNLSQIDPLAIVSVNDNPASRTEGEMDAEGLAHRTVTSAVLRGDYDIGTIQSRYFESFRRKGVGLVELARYGVPGDIHVAKAELPADIIKAFQDALASMRTGDDRNMMKRLQASPILGFDRVTDEDFADLHSMLTNELRQFEMKLPKSASPK